MWSATAARLPISSAVHKYKPNAAEASAAAVKAGTDLTCGNEYRSLTEAVKSQLISETEIDGRWCGCSWRGSGWGCSIPLSAFRSRRFPYSEIDSEAHRKLALEAARKSIVLLRNDNQTLPLKAGVKKIAVIGPAADDPEALLGNYNGFSSKQVSSLRAWSGSLPGRRKSSLRWAQRTRLARMLRFLPRRSPVCRPNTSITPASRVCPDCAAPKFVPPWGRFDPALAAAGIPRTGFSVRWTGTLRPPVTGDYLLCARNAMRVFIDDKEVVGANAARGLARVREAHVLLEARHSYHLRVEYVPVPTAADAQAAAQITWIPPAEPLLAEATEAVKSADVAIVFVGLNANLEGEEMSVSNPRIRRRRPHQHRAAGDAAEADRCGRGYR